MSVPNTRPFYKVIQARQVLDEVIHEIEQHAQELEEIMAYAEAVRLRVQTLQTQTVEELEAIEVRVQRLKSRLAALDNTTN